MSMGVENDEIAKAEEWVRTLLQESGGIAPSALLAKSAGRFSTEAVREGIWRLLEANAIQLTEDRNLTKVA
jgi:hypothetical protein